MNDGVALCIEVERQHDKARRVPVESLVHRHARRGSSRRLRGEAERVDQRDEALRVAAHRFVVRHAAQMARGAHYASHTLWAAWLCWVLGLAVLGSRRAASPNPNAQGQATT